MCELTWSEHRQLGAQRDSHPLLHLLSSLRVPAVSVPMCVGSRTYRKQSYWAHTLTMTPRGRSFSPTQIQKPSGKDSNWPSWVTWPRRYSGGQSFVINGHAIGLGEKPGVPQKKGMLFSGQKDSWPLYTPKAKLFLIFGLLQATEPRSGDLHRKEIIRDYKESSASDIIASWLRRTAELWKTYLFEM